MEVAGTVVTGAGMCGLWSPAAFSAVVDLDTWEEALLADDDIAAHVAAGAFVPLNVGADGAFGVVARVGTVDTPARLTPREGVHLLVESEPYLFVSAGTAMLSGIEHVAADAREGLPMAVPPGRWRVTVALIEWDAEPGARDGSGGPGPGALPDFVVLAHPDTGAGPYRRSILTFDQPRAA
ncbi:hypothetical protein [Spirilliplanes yamanashiensis]|uniref:Uncharacterized protein n=1 Tax=Spirilliplanes yamanashiensis TaxID=42233 RepID=A0A8J3YCA5_9ACTN|nr:hypothetical protein [Spirilliplanes yamanashiensis]MDP9819009.1 hypothetical protein [Spirilliplanes yamanashiensis]GIJ05464.1 hypothetical protein Sya03_48160 [Spirilliplanes yamanashiensis]